MVVSLKAQQSLEIGNAEFVDECFDTAVDKYNEGCETLENYLEKDSKLQGEATDAVPLVKYLLRRLYKSRGLAYLKLGFFRDATEDFQKAVNLIELTSDEKGEKVGDTDGSNLPETLKKSGLSYGRVGIATDAEELEFLEGKLGQALFFGGEFEIAKPHFRKAKMELWIRKCEVEQSGSIAPLKKFMPTSTAGIGSVGTTTGKKKEVVNADKPFKTAQEYLGTQTPEEIEAMKQRLIEQKKVDLKAKAANTAAVAAAKKDADEPIIEDITVRGIGVDLG
jgi:tetratricopeptide (TPR) repeat protein